MNSPIGNQVPLLAQAQGLYDQIETHDKPTARNMILLHNQLVKILRSIHCEIQNTGTHNYSFLVFSDEEFLMLPGIHVPAVPANPNATPPTLAVPIQPGQALVLPSDVGITPALSTVAGLHSFNFDRGQWNLYQQVINLTLLCIQKAYPNGGHFLDMMDEFGCLNDSPLDVYNALWNLAIPQEEKDAYIIENEDELKREYDPSQPVNMYYNAIQLAVSTLKRLGEPALPRIVIRNCLSEFRKHADLSRTCNKWIRDQTGLQPTWNEFKQYFSKAIRLIENDPSTKRSLDMANSVQESVATNSTDIQTMAGALIPLKDTITTLEKEIAALKMTTQAPLANAATTPSPSAYDQLLAKYENYKRSNPSNGGRGGRGGGRGGGRSAGRGGRGGRGTDGARTYVKHRNDLPDIQGWGKERSQRNNPDSNEWCHSCGFDVIHNSTNCRHRLDGHDATAVWTDRTRLPTSGSPRNCHFIVSPS